MTNEILQPYIELVPFLGRTLGPNYEVVLHEAENNNCIIAIANGHVSGRQLGAPPTHKTLQIMQEARLKNALCETNFLGFSATGKPLRSSIFFIRDKEQKLVGLLCVNFDDSRFRDQLAQVLALCHPRDFMDENVHLNFSPELFGVDDKGESHLASPASSDAVVDLITHIIAESQVPVDRMTQEEKMDVVDKLNFRGVFRIKGAVGYVAEMLKCSEPTVYRYLSKLSKRNQT